MLSGIFWAPNTLLPAMAGFSEVVGLSVDSHLKQLARDIENYAQDNAPWEDRSGDARAGLNTTVVVNGHEHAIILAHSVDYGLWLEIRWSGQYAIIMPTIEHFGAEALSGIKLIGVAEGSASTEDSGDE